MYTSKGVLRTWPPLKGGGLVILSGILYKNHHPTPPPPFVEALGCPHGLPFVGAPDYPLILGCT
jgi:hypothetical protein